MHSLIIVIIGCLHLLQGFELAQGYLYGDKAAQIKFLVLNFWNGLFHLSIWTKPSLYSQSNFEGEDFASKLLYQQTVKTLIGQLLGAVWSAVSFFANVYHSESDEATCKSAFW